MRFPRLMAPLGLSVVALAATVAAADDPVAPSPPDEAAPASAERPAAVSLEPLWSFDTGG